MSIMKVGLLVRLYRVDNQLLFLQKEGPNAPLNELDENGCCPLMYAAIADAVPAVEMLLNFGARRDTVSSLHDCIVMQLLDDCTRWIQCKGQLYTMLLSLVKTRLSEFLIDAAQIGHLSKLYLYYACTN